MPASGHLTSDDVRKVARLACLQIGDDQVEAHRASLAAVLGYIERLQSIDLTTVEPLAHPSDAVNRLVDDVPGPTLDTATLMRMAPDREAPFIKVPKVLGEAQGA